MTEKQVWQEGMEWEVGKMRFDTIPGTGERVHSKAGIYIKNSGDGDWAFFTKEAASNWGYIKQEQIPEVSHILHHGDGDGSNYSYGGK